MIRLIAIWVAAALLTSCAAPVTTGGSSVRQIAPDAKSGCKFLAAIEVTGGLVYSSATEARRDMLNKVRNETARLGGNAYALTEVVVERGFSLPFAQADVYVCP